MGKLVITRRYKETFIIQTKDGPITITTLSPHPVRIAIQAPNTCTIYREELITRNDTKGTATPHTKQR